MKGEKINYCGSERHKFLQETHSEQINVYRIQHQESNNYSEMNIKREKEKINYYGK